MELALIYLLAINLVAFLTMGLDKWKARRDKWRVPEKTLFLLVIIGGSLGGILGMFAFRHKTKHWYFRFGFPAILVLQIAAVVAVYCFIL